MKTIGGMITVERVHSCPLCEGWQMRCEICGAEGPVRQTWDRARDDAQDHEIDHGADCA